MFKFIFIFAIGALSYKLAFEQNLLPKSWDKKVSEQIQKSAEELCKKYVQNQ